MSGHSKWAQIKHQKAAGDAKKSKLFAKISHSISIAARNGKDPAMNSVLRDAIAKAKEANMPSDNIQKAIERSLPAGRQGGVLEEVLYEVFGPAGCAILIEGITDNKNRTLAEVRHILSKHELQLVGAGSALWAFEKTNQDPAKGGAGWRPKHTIEISKEDQKKLKSLFEELDELEDIQEITTNCNFGT